jgi:hyperosmotically inducible periplasmic protein
MEVRRLRAPLVVMAAIALAACSKQVGNNAESKTSVGTKVDHAQEKLQRAGERAREEIQEATEKTQQAISKAGDKLSPGSRGTNTDIPYSAPPTPASSLATPATGATPAAGTTPTPGGTAAAATNSAASTPAQGGAETPMSTTTTLSSGPSTSVKVTGISKETRATINDAAITTSIRADFLKDPDLSVLKIDVNTTDGVVTLNGRAENESAKARAARMAQSVKGVRAVRNFLTVKGVG